jgi:hypothetical protein
MNVRNATGVACVQGVGCDYTSCQSGFYDGDGDRTNGCEAAKPDQVTEHAALVQWLISDVMWTDHGAGSFTWSDQSGNGFGANSVPTAAAPVAPPAPPAATRWVGTPFSSSPRR